MLLLSLPQSYNYSVFVIYLSFTSVVDLACLAASTLINISTSNQKIKTAQPQTKSYNFTELASPGLQCSSQHKTTLEPHPDLY